MRRLTIITSRTSWALLFLLLMTFASCSGGAVDLISGTASVTSQGTSVYSESLVFPANPKKREVVLGRLVAILLKEEHVEATPILTLSMEQSFGLGLNVPAGMETSSKASSVIVIQFVRLADGSAQLRCGSSAADMQDYATQMDGDFSSLPRFAVEYIERVYSDLKSVSVGTAAR